MPRRAVVVEDDHIAGELAKSLLTQAGYEVVSFVRGDASVLAAIAERKAELVILDILMPGEDGLTLCHRIKGDPSLRACKVIVVSGKSFEADRLRAHRCGADFFIEKPFDPSSFSRLVEEVMSGTLSLQAGTIPEIPESTRPELRLSVWGCRGPGVAPGSARYGSRSSCVSVEWEGGFCIFDAGSGILDCGEELARRGTPPEIWLFLSHFHRDHVEGLGAFLARLPPGTNVRLGASKDPDRTLASQVEAAVSLSATGPIGASVEIYEMKEERYEVFPGVALAAFYTNHPGQTLGFSLKARGKKLVYCPDSELYGEEATAFEDYDDKLARSCDGADLLIHDGAHAATEHLSLKMSGHSSALDAVEFAGKHGIGKLLVFHHDGRRSDEDLDRFAMDAGAKARTKNFPLSLAFARCGLKLGI